MTSGFRQKRSAPDYLVTSIGPFNHTANVTGSGSGTPVLDLANSQITTSSGFWG